MTINTNLNSMFAQRQQRRTGLMVNRSLNRLSSGLRINSAKDDAAGLSISNRMQTRIRSLNQAKRNMSDGISMFQTAEGGLSEITSMLQRVRELAVQSLNATNTGEDRQSLQNEADQLIAEINNIATTTRFNGLSLLNKGETVIELFKNSTGLASENENNAEKKDILENLESSWLEASEDMVETYYGLSADGAGLEIILDSPGTPGGAGAWVSNTGYDAYGRGLNLKLTMDMGDYSSLTDRLVAHEMTHAIMQRTVDMEQLIGSGANEDDALWFIEGAAEFIRGYDPVVWNIFTNGGADGGDTTRVVGQAVNAGWGGGSEDYADGFLAVRYMHETIGGDGVKLVMDELSGNVTTSKVVGGLTKFDRAIATASGGLWADQAAFTADYLGGNGATYLTNLLSSGELTNTDRGAIGGADVGGLGGARDTTKTGVVPDYYNPTVNPLSGFVETWADTGTGGGNVMGQGNGADTYLAAKVGDAAILAGAEEGRLEGTFQVGDDVLDTVSVEFANTDVASMALDAVDLVNDANAVLANVDRAISAVGAFRANLGAAQNRFEMAISVTSSSVEAASAASSRIRDADMALEMAGFTKNQILSRAVTSIIAQANTAPAMALQLLL